MARSDASQVGSGAQADATTRTAAIWISLLFLAANYILQQGELIYLHKVVAEMNFAHAERRMEVEVLLADTGVCQRQLSEILPRISAAESSAASQAYRMDLLVTASRTGWWSPETLALVGQENLYVKQSSERQWELVPE